MTLSILQLNMNGDSYWDNLIPFLTSHDFDVINLQELTGKGTRFGNLNSKRDTFAELNTLLGDKYASESQVTDTITSGPDSYFAIGIFFKKKFQLLEKQTVFMKKNTEPFPENAESFEGLGKALLHLKLAINNTPVSFLTTHCAWAPTPHEKPHQTAQAKILTEYLKTVAEPYVMTGDFNLPPDQPAIQNISKLAQNITSLYHIKNTLNPRFHNARELFPKGVAIDYIFLSSKIMISEFQVLEHEDISDHLGLTAKIEL